MHTRRFAESDRPALRRVYLETRVQAFDWMDTSSFAEDDFDRDTDGETIWVAADAECLLGFVSVWEPDNFIHNLFVHPGSARQGVGSALLSTCLREIGRPAVLKCLTQNARAKEFYLAKGWRVVADGDSSDGPYLVMHYVDPL